MLYLESPAGYHFIISNTDYKQANCFENWDNDLTSFEFVCSVGFSYWNKSSNFVFTDNVTAADNLEFLIKWFQLYPHYSKVLFLSQCSSLSFYIPHSPLSHFISSESFLYQWWVLCWSLHSHFSVSDRSNASNKSSSIEFQRISCRKSINRCTFSHSKFFFTLLNNPSHLSFQYSLCNNRLFFFLRFTLTKQNHFSFISTTRIFLLFLFVMLMSFTL